MHPFLELDSEESEKDRIEMPLGGIADQIV